MLAPPPPPSCASNLVFQQCGSPCNATSRTRADVHTSLHATLPVSVRIADLARALWPMRHCQPVPDSRQQPCQRGCAQDPCLPPKHEKRGAGADGWYWTGRAGLAFANSPEDCCTATTSQQPAAAKPAAAASTPTLESRPTLLIYNGDSPALYYTECDAVAVHSNEFGYTCGFYFTESDGTFGQLMPRGQTNFYGANNWYLANAAPPGSPPQSPPPPPPPAATRSPFGLFPPESSAAAPRHRPPPPSPPSPNPPPCRQTHRPLPPRPRQSASRSSARSSARARRQLHGFCGGFAARTTSIAVQVAACAST